MNSLVSQVKDFDLYPKINVFMCGVGVGHEDVYGRRLEREFIKRER